MCASKATLYEYMDEDDGIDDELKCLICKHPLQSPFSHSLCHYDFCQDCIEPWLKEYQICPGCEPISDDNMEQKTERINLLEIFSFVPINTRIVLNRLDQLLVRCLLCGEENIQRSYYEDHEKICMKKIVKCQSIDMKCPWKGIREKLDKHLKVCIFQKIRPIIDKFHGKINTLQKNQNQMKISVKKLEEQMAFIHAFINEGVPMNKTCSISPSQCQFKAIDQDFLKVFTCRMCNRLFQCDQISIHACNNRAICRFCYEKSYSEINSEDKNENTEMFSPISSLHSE